MRGQTPIATIDLSGDGLARAATRVLAALEPGHTRALDAALIDVSIEIVALELCMRPPYQRYGRREGLRAIRKQRQRLRELRVLDEAALRELCRRWAPVCPAGISRSREGWMAIAIELASIHPALSSLITSEIDQRRSESFVTLQFGDEDNQIVGTAWDAVDARMRARESAAFATAA